MSDGVKPRPDIERVTICINTVDRPYCLQRLVKSIRAVYPSIAIIVADQNPPEAEMEAFCDAVDVKVVRMPYGAGVGAGRNAAARHVETEFILYCDDDFLFSEETDFSPLIRIFEAEPEIDILGGLVRDIINRLDAEQWEVRRWEAFLIPDRARGLIMMPDIDFFTPLRKEVAGTAYFLSDTVLNWNLCRREAIERGAVWDPRFICNGEHEDFYLNVKENTDVKAAYCPSLVVYHHSPEDFGYGPKRNARDGWKLLGEKWGLSECLQPSEALRSIFSLGRLEIPSQSTLDPLLLPNHARYGFDRDKLGADRPKAWPVSEATQSGLDPASLQISIPAGGIAEINYGQSFSLPVQIHNRSADRWGCLGEHAPRLGYSVYRAGAQEPLARNEHTTLLAQDITIGATFHYLNIDASLRALPGEAVDLCAELRGPDGATIAVSQPHRVAIADATVKYRAELGDKILFSREGLPQFIRAAFGLSFAEPWGRWSDANLGETVEFHFVDDLPEVFDLVLECRTFAGNSGQPILVRAGSCTGTFTIGEKDQRVQLRLRPMTRTKLIAIIPPFPTSPSDISDCSDRRRIAIAFASMTIEYPKA